MADFTRIIHDVRDRYDVRVKRWRRSMSGKAWRVYHHNGRVDNWIESPKPKTPISLAIFLHEIGHHAIGFEKYRRRCEEEFYVWIWALSAMRRYGVEPDAKVLRRVEMSMRYAVGKAVRRGMKKLPEALLAFAPKAA
ncbi:MAG: hypothetical protein M3O30_01535 [Planctomycetota bacterium]|nr:hypothetical protein [Planctomycetota bacterium]